MDYPRLIYPKLEAELLTKEAIVITGMRRVGKTTALNHLFNLVPSTNKVIFDLENPLHRKIFESNNYDAIWQNLAQFHLNNNKRAYIGIDEAQNLPDISHIVKYFFDHWNVKWILTGSSSYYLRNLFPESLAGRKIIFELFPLTFEEFLTFKEVARIQHATFKKMAEGKNAISHAQLKPLFEEYMKFGGFPSVVLEPHHERKRVLLMEIFTSYFEKDAKNLADFTDMSKLRDLILLLVSRVGSRIEIVKLANSLGVSRQTVYGYLSFLEQTYFIFLLEKHSASRDRRAAGSKKLFFSDAGLLSVLGSVSEGQAFEQSVFQSLRTNHALSYFTNKRGYEIDFICDDTIGVEVKTAASKRDISSLKQRAGVLRLHEVYVVTREYFDEKHVIPATDL